MQRAIAEEELQDWKGRALAMEAAVRAAIVGQEEALRGLLIATFARGHVMLEGDVGVGKTTLLRAFARTLGGGYERIEGTVDLMPSDLVYYTYVDQDGKPRVAPGPLLKHGERLAAFFFNEVNRARPQIHALMLRVMAERSVTAFNREHRFPYLQVFADRNRVEREETFEIPAAARDRFLMEIAIEPPADREAQRELMVGTRFHDPTRLIQSLPEAVVDYRELNAIAASIQAAIHTSKAVEDYVLDLCRATADPGAFGVRLDGVEVSGLVQAGVSPRGMSYLLRAARVAAWLKGHDSVLPDDVRDIAAAVIGHRVFLRPAYELRRAEIAGQLTTAILRRVAAP